MKLSCIISIISGITHFAAGQNVPRILEKVGSPHIQGIVDRARAATTLYSSDSIEQAVRDFAFDIQEADDDCIDLSLSYYNGTNIANASIVAFFVTGNLEDPDFDLDAFFDDMNFDESCEAMGGEVETADIKLICEDGESIVENYRFCKPTNCIDFEYWLVQDSFLVATSFLSAIFSGTDCIASVISGKAPSYFCVSSMGTVYNETGILANSSPEAFVGSVFSEEAPEVLEDCKQFSKPAAGQGDILVCDMEKYKEDYAEIKEACESFMSTDFIAAEIQPMDIYVDFPMTHVTVRRYPFCRPEVCTDFDIKSYYDYISGFYSGEHTGNATGIELGFEESIVNSCDETLNHRAFIKKRADDKVVHKTCKWLKLRPDGLKTKFCKKKNGMDGYEVASKVCPSTCCACKEDPENVFLKKATFGQDGMLKVVHKTCEWFDTAPESEKQLQCGKKSASYVKGYPPASVACPESCGTCTNSTD